MKFFIFKFIEIVIKTVVVLSCVLSVLMWIILFIFYARSGFDINFIAKDSCIDNTARVWNNEAGVCMWVNEETK
jgi:hypothetical protein